MIRIFRAHPSSGYQWTGRCEVDSYVPNYYTYYRSWPYKGDGTIHRFSYNPLEELITGHMWIEDVDEDLVVDEGL